MIKAFVNDVKGFYMGERSKIAFWSSGSNKVIAGRRKQKKKKNCYQVRRHCLILKKHEKEKHKEFQTI